MTFAIAALFFGCGSDKDQNRETVEISNNISNKALFQVKKVPCDKTSPSGGVKSINLNIIRTEIHSEDHGWIVLQEEDKIYNLLEVLE